MKYFGVTVPFMESIGLLPVDNGPDWARTSLPFRKDLANSTGHMHGGLLMSALDFTMSAAARGKEKDLAGMATIDMNTSFIAPATTDMVFETKCLRRGRSIAFTEGEARDAKGTLVCKASATFKLRRKST